jgi:hypothetical protein
MRFCRFSIYLFFLSLVIGCQAGMVRPTPPPGKAAIQVVHYSPNAGEMPMGSFVPKDSSVVIRLNPSQSAGVGMLFGQVGTALASEGARRDAEGKLPVIAALSKMDLQAEANAAFARMDAEKTLGGHLVYGPRPDGGKRYEMGAYLFVQINSEERIQLSVIARAAEQGMGGGGWVGQYIRHIPRLLTAAELEQEIAVPNGLQQSVRDALQISLDVMVADLNGELGQPREPTVRVSSPNVLFLSYGEWSGSFVGKLGDAYNIVRSNCSLGDPACFGLHILDMDQATISQRALGG